jgi:hypothetical protein
MRVRGTAPCADGERVRAGAVTMIAVPAKAATRIYPQMSQMFTDEERHLCSSVNICGSDFRHRPSAEGLAGAMIKAGEGV